MPSFNQVEYLEEAIRSVLRQAPHFYEFLILDGGSTDGSVDVIRKYESQITWWTSGPDGGQSAAIASGFERATGDVLCWLNSDDAYLPGALKRVAEEFGKDSRVEVVSGYLVYIDDGSRILECARVPTDRSIFERFGLILMNQPATFFTRDLYLRVGGLDATFQCGMDADLWGRFLLADARWNQLEDYLAAFRKHTAAKGGGGKWLERYREEGVILRARYPQLYGGARKERRGRTLYRFSQVISGRHFMGRIDSRRMRGTKIEELWDDASA